MRKIALTSMLLMILTGCKPPTEPYVADDRPDPVCDEGQSYTNGVCVDDVDEPEPVDYEPLRSLFQSYHDALAGNDDFANVWFQSEKNYYRTFFENDGSYVLYPDDLITYDVHDVIYQEGARCAADMKRVLTDLLSLTAIAEREYARLARFRKKAPESAS